mmetsp:Transcript_17521/g.59171  ORF Transcript_17521/g.59171 Transcript_17521/m.59171 type:complete len:247 (-) Transcript_17521:773-1513(-)
MRLAKRIRRQHVRHAAKVADVRLERRPERLLVFRRDGARRPRERVGEDAEDAVHGVFAAVATFQLKVRPEQLAARRVVAEGLLEDGARAGHVPEGVGGKGGEVHAQVRAAGAVALRDGGLEDPPRLADVALPPFKVRKLQRALEQPRRDVVADALVDLSGLVHEPAGLEELRLEQGHVRRRAKVLRCAVDHHTCGVVALGPGGPQSVPDPKVGVVGARDEATLEDGFHAACIAEFLLVVQVRAPGR